MIGARGLSQLLGSIAGGTLADRLDQRRVLIVNHLFCAGLALALFFLAVTGGIQIWHLLVAGVINGAVSAVNGPSHQSITFSVVGADRLLNARAFFFMAAGLVRIGSALAGGFLIQQIGIGTAYLLLCGALLLAAGALVPLRVVVTRPAATERPLEALTAGLRYAWRTTPVRSLLLLSFLTEAFGYSYQTVLPVIARDVLAVDALGLGQLIAMGAVGQLGAAILIAALGNPGRKHALLLASCVGFGVSIMLLALSPLFTLSLAIMVVLGAFAGAFDTLIATVIQLTVHGDMRGRVMGLFVATWGVSSFAGVGLGALTTIAGAPVALAAIATVLLVNGIRLTVLGFAREGQPHGA